MEKVPYLLLWHSAASDLGLHVCSSLSVPELSLNTVHSDDPQISEGNFHTY